MRHLRLTEEQLAAIRRKKPAAPLEQFEPKRKYRNQPTVIDGISFHSRKEAKRYQELRLLESTGRISSLNTQVRYELNIGLEHVCEYVADLVYRDAEHKVVVEDVKGYRQGTAYDLFRLKARLMKACYGITVREI